MSYKRSSKVSGIIHKAFSRIILEDIMDPRLRNVTISRCEMSTDLKYAKVFFSVLGGLPEARKEALSGMKSAKGYCKKELGKRCGLRIVPELSFHYDDSVDYNIHMGELFNQIEQERKHKHIDEEDENKE